MIFKKVENRITCLLLIAFAILQSCSPKIEEKEAYSIHGKIVGIENGTVLLSKLDLATNERVNVDTADITDGVFTLVGSIESPYLHTLFINGNEHKIHFFLENSRIDISANIRNLEQAKIIGSREDSLFHSYSTDDIFDRKHGMEIMLNYPDYSFTAFTAYYQFQIHNIQQDTLDIIMSGFPESVRKTVYFKHLNELYNTIKRVAISQPAPKFAIPDTAGNTVQLDDLKGRYVLIDFWASWCPPCRAANPELIEVYNRYSGKDFTIVGISVDKSREQWLNAIESDKLPWINLSNLKGWDEVSSSYGVRAVPQNFLLDPKGIIIDKNIEPDHLSKKLELIL